MDFASLKGQLIVVTGASSGIGRAVALQCAVGGADIILTYQNSADAAEDAAQEIRACGVRAEVLQLDLAEPASRDACFGRCVAKGPVAAVVNNAGVDLLTGDARELSYSDKLRKLLDVDVTGTVDLARRFGTHMSEHGSGAILTIGWDQSDRGMGGDSGELFSTAKNAVMGFTRSLAVSLAPAVRVNCIAPGWIQTAWGQTASPYWQQRVMEETPLQRWGQPDDIACMARFLISPQAAFITGQIINVNGGAVR